MELRRLRKFKFLNWNMINHVCDVGSGSLQDPKKARPRKDQFFAPYW
jgi:hypothetical protein